MSTQLPPDLERAIAELAEKSEGNPNVDWEQRWGNEAFIRGARAIYAELAPRIAELEAENDRVCRELEAYKAMAKDLMADRDQLKAELAVLKQGTNALAELFKEREALKAELAAFTAQAERAAVKLQEVLSYLPKVPTEPYERELAKTVERYRVALEFYAACPPRSGMIEEQINGGEWLPLGTTARAALEGADE